MCCQLKTYKYLCSNLKREKMKQNWYKSREEIKEEKKRNRRIVRNIIVGYLIFASIVLLLSYCENR